MIADDRRFGLDFLRALAIGMVVLIHIGVCFYPTHLEWFVRLYPDGVCLFFVLSGFLITLSLQHHIERWGKSPRSFAHFWAKRAIRTIPPFFVALALCTTLIILLGSHQPKPSKLSLVFLQNFAWAIKGGFDEGWSLSVEEWYYAAFVVLGIVLPFRGSRSLGAAAVALLVMSIVYRVLRAVHPYHEMWAWNANINDTVLARLDGPAVGVLAALSVKRWPELWRSRAVGRVCIVLGLIGTFGLTNLGASLIDWPNTHLLFPPLFYAVPSIQAVAWGLLLVPAVQMPSPGGILDSGIRQMARSAFSIYLTHMTIVALVIVPAIANGRAAFIAFLILTPIVSQLFYVLVERPAFRASALVDRAVAEVGVAQLPQEA